MALTEKDIQDLSDRIFDNITGSSKPYDTQPLDNKEKEIVIPVDKTKFYIKFKNETENTVDVVLEPK